MLNISLHKIHFEEALTKELICLNLTILNDFLTLSKIDNRGFIIKSSMMIQKKKILRYLSADFNVFFFF